LSSAIKIAMVSSHFSRIRAQTGLIIKAYARYHTAPARLNDSD
jgi:hypothetical protein